MNKHAQALGRMAKGRKKTMSPAAIAQRRLAAKKRAKAIPMPIVPESTSYVQTYKLPSENNTWTKAFPL